MCAPNSYHPFIDGVSLTKTNQLLDTSMGEPDHQAIPSSYPRPSKAVHQSRGTSLFGGSSLHAFAGGVRVGHVLHGVGPKMLEAEDVVSKCS